MSGTLSIVLHVPQRINSTFGAGVSSLTLNFLLKNIKVPTPVIFNSEISVFTSRHRMKEKLSVPSKYLRSK